MMFMQIDSGGDRNYAYIIASEKTRRCAVIDPSPDAEKVLLIVRENSLIIKYVINTHSHYDHLQGNDIIRSADAKGEIKFINCSPHFLLKEDEIINLN